MKYIFILSLGLSFIFINSCKKSRRHTGREIQSAIDIVFEEGGGIVELTEGQYIIRAAIYLKDNVQLIGSSKKTILKKNSGSSSCVISDIHKGDREIYIENTCCFEEGDSIALYCKKLGPKEAFISEITTIMPNMICLKDPVACDIPLLFKPEVFSSFPIIFCKNCQNVKVQNLLIDGNSFENPTVDIWWDSGINIRDSNCVKVKNVTVLNSPGDGISINNAHHVNIYNCLVDSSARLGIHVGGRSCNTYVSDSKIINSGKANIFNHTDGLYLCQKTVLGFYEKNVIQNSKGAGISIGQEDSANVFLGNTLYNNEIGVLFRYDTFKTFAIIFLQNMISGSRHLDFCSEKPIHYIFMDQWPIKCFICPESTFLFSYDTKINKWIKTN